jgi:ATP-dependent helicase HepA
MPLCPSCVIEMDLKQNKYGGWFYGCPNFYDEDGKYDRGGCRELVPYQRMRHGGERKTLDFQRNEFVYVPNRGFGKVRRVVEEDGVGRTVKVEFFTTPTEGGTEEETFPIHGVERMLPPSGHRCFFRHEGRWKAGRVHQFLDDEVQIIPVLRARVRQTVPLADVFVRRLGGALSPVEVIKVGVLEEPHHARSRADFVEDSIRFRSASRGMVGLSSSRIELHRHQVEVVSRVLRDPVQRYLLADEVGLGKTIEAGAILSQFLLDHPEARAEILLPPLLVEQWRAELREKFGLEEDRLTLSKQDREWEPSGSDFLIVDEAHNIAAHAFSDNDELTTLYQRLANASKEVSRVLLLSATPLLHNEDAFLGLLHLLDPLLYPLDGLEDFKVRVDSRRDLAKRFQGFQPTSPDFVLERHSGAFSELFPNDNRLGEYLGELNGLLESGAKPNRRKELVRLARVHISETYKLHRRVLRTRRNSPLATEFPVRGREDPTVLHYEIQMGVRIEEWLTEWLNLMAGRKEDGRFDSYAEATLLAILDRWDSAPIVLIRCIRSILDPNRSRQASLTQAEERGVRGFAASEDERSHLERLGLLLLEYDRSDEWLSSMAARVTESPDATLVFCGDTVTANLLADRVQQLDGQFNCARYVDSSSTDLDVEEEVARFRRKRARYLICDRSAEEGRNFQYANAVFHVGLPWNPNRIEQRIGRVDRFSSGKPVKSHVIVRPGSVTDSWCQLLRDGFGVFSDSIATLQHVLAKSVRDVVDTLVEQGPDGFVGLAPDLRESLKTELEDILELEHLESIEDESRLTQGVFDELVDIEADSASLGQSVTRWLTSTKHLPGGLGLQVRAHPQKGTFKRFGYPEKGNQRGTRLVDPPVHREVINFHLGEFLTKDSWATFDRNAACAEGDGILMRPGAPFFDAVARLTDAEDLGQTFGFWRKKALAEPLLAVRFSFRATATGDGARKEFINHGLDAGGLDSLMRTMDDFFPPQALTVHMDHFYEPLSDENEDLVASAYTNADQPLTQEDTDRLIDRFELDWENWWQKLAAIATERVQQHVGLNEAKSQGKERAEQAFADADLQIGLRLEAEKDEHHRVDLENELSRLESAKDAVVAVIESVEPIIEVVGLVFVASAATGLFSD